MVCNGINRTRIPMLSKVGERREGWGVGVVKGWGEEGGGGWGVGVGWVGSGG